MGWEQIANIRGPAGADGAQGEPGVDGADGASLPPAEAVDAASETFAVDLIASLTAAGIMASPPPPPGALWLTAAAGDVIDYAVGDFRLAVSIVDLDSYAPAPDGVFAFREIAGTWSAISTFLPLPALGAGFRSLGQITANDESLVAGGVGDYMIIGLNDSPQDTADFIALYASYGVTVEILANGLYFRETAARPFTLTIAPPPEPSLFRTLLLGDTIDYDPGQDPKFSPGPLGSMWVLDEAGVLTFVELPLVNGTGYVTDQGIGQFFLVTANTEAAVSLLVLPLGSYMFLQAGNPYSQVTIDDGVAMYLGAGITVEPASGPGVAFAIIDNPFTITEAPPPPLFRTVSVGDVIDDTPADLVYLINASGIYVEVV